MNLAVVYTESTQSEDFTSQTATWGTPPFVKSMYYEYTHDVIFRQYGAGWDLYSYPDPTLDITTVGAITITDTYSYHFYDDDGEHECIAQTYVTGTYSSTPKTVKVESWYGDWYPLGYPWDGTWDYDYEWN